MPIVLLLHSLFACTVILATRAGSKNKIVCVLFSLSDVLLPRQKSAVSVACYYLLLSIHPFVLLVPVSGLEESSLSWETKTFLSPATSASSSGIFQAFPGQLKDIRCIQESPLVRLFVDFFFLYRVVCIHIGFYCKWTVICQQSRWMMIIAPIGQKWWCWDRADPERWKFFYLFFFRKLEVLCATWVVSIMCASVQIPRRQWEKQTLVHLNRTKCDHCE